MPFLIGRADFPEEKSAFTPGLPQYLGYEAFVGPSIIQMKDGALLVCFEYVGPDQELNEHTRRAWEADLLARDLQLTGGWMFEGHTVIAHTTVPPRSHFCPDAVSALVYEARAKQYAQEKKYVKKRDVMVLTYLPPDDVKQTVSDFFLEERTRTKQWSRVQLLEQYVREVMKLVDALDRFLTLRRLSEAETLHFLHFCVTGEDRAVGVPEDGGDLDYAIGTVELAPHDGTVNNELHTQAIGIIGWPGDGTKSQMFDPVFQLGIPLRFQQREIFIPTAIAVKLLERRRNWTNQLNDYNPFRLWWTAAQPSGGADPNNKNVVRFNKAAAEKANSIEDEIALIESGEVVAGYYTGCVILHDTDPDLLAQNTALVAARIRSLGFSPIIEKDNLADAIGGSWPGHGSRNIRLHILNNRQFSRLWSTSNPWEGEETAPCPFFPEGSGPLLLTTTAGKQIHRANIHAHDLGNFLNIGIAGRGKTFLNGQIALAYRQYPNSQIFILDRDAALLPPTLLCGGEFFDADALSYAPFGQIHKDAEFAWALTFIELLAQLRHCKLSPTVQGDIAKALVSLREMPAERRTMSQFLWQLQPRGGDRIKDALSFYTLENPGAILDGKPGPEHTASWQTYDMLRLIGAGEMISTPVIHYLLHMMDRYADGRMILKIIEEGWQVAGNKLIQSSTEEDSANNRKRNIATGLVLHSPANLDAFERRNLLTINMGSLFLLPNEKAMTTGENGEMEHYLTLGLTPRHCQALAQEMVPRRHYMEVKGDLARVFEFEPTEWERAILGVNGRSHKEELLELKKQYGPEMPGVWLRKHKHEALAQEWETRFKQKEAA